MSKNSKLTNLCFNFELIRIIVSNGRIDEELGEFSRDIKNLIKLKMNGNEKLGKLIFLKRRLQEEST